MAKQTFVVTGNKEVDRMLRELGSKRARAAHMKAARVAAKMVLDHARNIAPVQSGVYRRSLAVRAMKRSRRGIGVRVTQKEIAGKKVFYGAFLELGYIVGGKRRRISTEWDGANLRIKKRTLQVKQAKVPARWIMRRAGTDKEMEARDIYFAEITKFIDQEAKK